MMNHDEVLSVYQTVSDLTGQMLAAAQSRDWENLAALESHCASHVRALKNGAPTEPLTGATRARKVTIIQQILAHDRAIRDLVQPWMAELSALLNNAATQRKLSAAYER